MSLSRRAKQALKNHDFQLARRVALQFKLAEDIYSYLLPKMKDQQGTIYCDFQLASKLSPEEAMQKFGYEQEHMMVWDMFDALKILSGDIEMSFIQGDWHYYQIEYCKS